MIYLTFVGSNKKRLQYCYDISYVSFASTKVHPNLFNKVFFTTTTMNSVIWFHNLYYMARNAIAHVHTYDRVSTSQLNLSYLLFLETHPLASMFSLAKAYINHFKFRRTIKKYGHDFEAMKYQLVGDCERLVKRIGLRNTLTWRNPIDFSKGYQQFHDNFDYKGPYSECELPNIEVGSSRFW